MLIPSSLTPSNSLSRSCVSNIPSPPTPARCMARTPQRWTILLIGLCQVLVLPSANFEHQGWYSFTVHQVIYFDLFPMSTPKFKIQSSENEICVGARERREKNGNKNTHGPEPRPRSRQFHIRGQSKATG